MTTATTLFSSVYVIGRTCFDGCFLFYLMTSVVRKCSVKKMFLETSQNSRENTCARVSFLIKFTDFIKKRLWRRRFPASFINCEHLRIPFFLFYWTPSMIASVACCCWQQYGMLKPLLKPLLKPNVIRYLHNNSTMLKSQSSKIKLIMLLNVLIFVTNFAFVATVPGFPSLMKFFINDILFINWKPL